MTQRELVRLEAKKELARRDFFHYSNLMAGDFYRKDRTFLVDLCNELQEFYFSKDEVLVVNMPPRHGKSRTASMFTQWVFGQNPSEKVMTGSYNEVLSKSFSRAVRDAIIEEKVTDDYIVYGDIFPNTKLKFGETGSHLWTLEGEHTSYLATSPKATATGFGASLLIIDDLIKNAEEAYNENSLRRQWEWFTNTMLSRLEEGGKIIIVMTRWSTNDLAGRAIRHFEEQGRKLRLVNYKALQDDGTMLCEDILSRESYDMRVKLMGKHVASANYQQHPIDLEGTLYKNLKTYKELPGIDAIFNYTDVADQGKDWTCSICYVVYQGEAYVIDLIYSPEGMEITEPKTAEMLIRNDVSIAYLESNGGGRGFKRSVERILWEKYRTRKPTIRDFHQSKSKMARIITNSTFVMEHVYFPHHWDIKWPEFHTDVTTFQREGRNARDDAPDALTGVAESIMKKESDVSKQMSALRQLRL